MRSLLTVLGICGLIVTLLIVISLNAGKSNHNVSEAQSPLLVSGAKASATSFPTMPTIVPPDAEQLIMYPQTWDVSYDKIHEQDWRSLSFMTYAPSQQVMAFYDEQLTKKGWVFEWENKPSQATAPDRVNIDRKYSWSDGAGILPWDLALFINFQGEPRGLQVELSLFRVPNFDRIPLYPGAQKVQSVWVPSTRWKGFQEKHISYLTDATPKEVEMYYKALLPQCGWGGPSEGFEPGNNNDDISKGILFGWGTGGQHNLTSVGLAIVANQEPGGQTKVEMKLDGTINP